ncbi:MAG: hypothetical protein LBE78_10690 [Burkholderiaceae bacterium]|jgi:hypothetical protein|nr:hypothetical protein [Burkholderiaceae bacterium]
MPSGMASVCLLKRTVLQTGMRAAGRGWGLGQCLTQSRAATSILVLGGLRRHGKWSQYYRQVLLRFAPCSPSQTKEALIRRDGMRRRLSLEAAVEPHAFMWRMLNPVLKMSAPVPAWSRLVQVTASKLIGESAIF